MARLVNPIVQRLGGTLVLIVPGRQTGRVRSVPLGRPFDEGGVRYVVAAGGETQWVRNLRAAGKAQLRLRGVTTPFRAVEIVGFEHHRIVAAYRAKQRRTVETFFRHLPDPADHPVLRVDPLTRIGRPDQGASDDPSAPRSRRAGSPLTGSRGSRLAAGHHFACGPVAACRGRLPAARYRFRHAPLGRSLVRSGGCVLIRSLVMLGGMDDHKNPTRYEIHVQGLLSDRLLSAFPELRARTRNHETLLTGALPDQSALHGVLSRIEALGLELLEVRRTRTQPGTTAEADEPGAQASKRVGDSSAESEDGSSD